MTEQRDLANITDQTSQLTSEYRIPGAAIGILHNGTNTDFAVGLMNQSTSEPATTDNIYQCGSMTKTWTALPFMQLADEGKVHVASTLSRRARLPGPMWDLDNTALRLTAGQGLGVDEDGHRECGG